MANAQYTRAVAEKLSQQIEAAFEGNITDEQRDEIDLWQKGRALQQITTFYGWEVMKEMLEDYAIDAERKLASIDPASQKEVLSQHAVAFASRRLINIFVEDVRRAVEMSRRTPDVVKQAARRMPAPPES